MIRITMREVNGISVLVIEGQIDINASEIIETIGALLKKGKLKVLCNLENIENIDYSGLSILAVAYKSAENYRGILKFCGLQCQVRELIKTVRLDLVFDCYDTEEAALESFNMELSKVAEMSLRRQFQRATSHIKIRYRENKGSAENRDYTGQVLNIGGAGVFVRAAHIFPVKTRLVMEVSLPNEIAPLEVKGDVIWVADKQLQPHDYPGMGIHFTDLDPLKQKEVIEFVERNTTHRSETENA
ncbi:MAG: STAS domain-containing protein [Candidatus Omnitrophota bacterium]